VRFNASSQIAASSAVTVLSSGQLDLNGFSGTIGSLSMTGGNVDIASGTLTLNSNVTGNASSAQANITGNLSLGGATRTFTIADGTAALDLLIPAAITNGPATAGITKSGAGRLQLSGANTFGGAATVNQGSLGVGSPTALGAAGGGVTVNSSG